MIAEHLRRLHDLVVIADRFKRRRRLTSEEAACHKFRGHLAKYLVGMPGSRQVLKDMSEMDSIESILAAVDQILGT